MSDEGNRNGIGEGEQLQEVKQQEEEQQLSPLTINLVTFINEYTTKDGDESIINQIMEAITFKDPTRIFTFYIDYDSLPQKMKNYIIGLNDFNIFSKKFSEAVKSVVFLQDRTFHDKIIDINIQVRFKNFLYDYEKNEFPNLIPIRSINSDKMGRYLNFRGVIRNIISSKAKMKKQQFRCLNCDTISILDFNNIEFFNGKNCSNIQCNSENLEMIPTIGGTSDYQTLVIEELTGDSENDVASINVYVDTDLVNKFSLGNTVIVTGNVRLKVFTDEVVNQYKKKTGDMKVYKYFSMYGGSTNGIDADWFVEANYVEKISDTNIMFNSISSEEIEEIKRLSTDHHIIDKMIASFAPDIYGHDIVKEALLYQLVGGLGRSLDPTLDKRGEIHIFLLGDPSTAKSDLLMWALSIAHKSRFVQGGNMSKVGLTGGVEKTQGEEKWVLTAGLAPVTDMGMLGIDEMNDIPDETLNVLKEIMEKQTSTISKIRTGSFNSRVSILGSANPPKGGRYNKYKSFFENLGINISLFTRFDFVALFRDIPNSEKDAMIVDKIINSYEKLNIPPIPRDMLAKYIYFMKNQPLIPKLSDEAKNAIGAFYVKIRTIDMNENVQKIEEQEQVSMTTRQIQSIVRFSYARARLLNKPEVDISDVDAAIKIINFMLSSIGIDSETGKVDIGVLLGSESKTTMSRDATFFKLLERMAESFNNKTPYEQFINELRKLDKWKPEEMDDSRLERQIEKYKNQQNIIVANDYIHLAHFVRNPNHRAGGV
jgi:replicative DNA helicase Mcm